MVNHWTRYLDYFHTHNYRSSVHGSLRDRTTNDSRWPAWIIFHSALGYTILLIGFCAIIFRLPLRITRRKRWLHPWVGYAWVFGTIWMPITAIWCVLDKEQWDIIAFFIYSLFAAVQLGWICIKVYQQLLRSNIDERLPSVIAETSTTKSSKYVLSWKVFHASLMIYSYIMLLGAGISFPFRADQDYLTRYREGN